MCDSFHADGMNICIFERFLVKLQHHCMIVASLFLRFSVEMLAFFQPHTTQYFCSFKAPIVLFDDAHVLHISFHVLSFTHVGRATNKIASQSEDSDRLIKLEMVQAVILGYFGVYGERERDKRKRVLTA